tara:strand:- start:5316 stop:5561 length:246 start_codon:yes stop_codon:yes gene_type:complete
MTIPEKTAPLTEKEITNAADTFFPLFDIILSRMPEGSKIEDTLKVMENVARLAQKKRADDREKEIKEKFGFNKPTEEDDDA